MGRAKLNMELIPKKKSRHTTFKKRKEGVVKKLHELTTLCDVQACMIIYGPKQDETGLSEPETWPQNTDEIRPIIDIYKSKNKDSNNNRTFGLSDFFDDRQRKIEDELSKLRKKNRELKYPTRPEFMNFTTEEARLREFAASLVHKAGIVRSRIEFLRINNNNNQLGVHFQANHHSSYYPTIDHHQNPAMMLLMNDHRGALLGPGPSSGGGSNIRCASYEHQVFYEGMVDPTAMICHGPMQLARYYDPSLPPVPYMHVMPQPPHAAVSSYMQMPPLPEMQFPAKVESGGGGDEGGEGQQGNVTPQHGMTSHKESSSLE